VPEHPATLTPPRRPTLLFPSLLSSTAVTVVAEPNTASETPLHRHPTRDNCAVELAGPSLPTPAPWTELSSTGAAGGQAPVTSRAWQCPQRSSELHGQPVAPRSTVLWTESTDFPSKNNSIKSNFPIFLGKFAEKPLELQTLITFQPQLQIQ
jgi:hypothetical protein